MSLLHYSLFPEAKRNKELFVSGYIRSNTAEEVIVPTDIINLCHLFYNEVLYWIIDAEDLLKYEKLKKHEKKQSKYYDKIFDCHDLQIRCSFTANAHSDHFNSKVSAIYLHVQMGAIEAFNLYFTLYCHENHAYFRRIITKQHCWKRGDSWPSDKYSMILNVNDFNQIHFSHYIDVLYIKYKNGTTYNKPILMRRQLEYTWNIKNGLLDQMRKAVIRQLFFSDLFDEINNNWCLCLFPIGQNLNAALKDRKIGLVLRIFKIPSQISKLKVKLTVTNSYDDTKLEKQLEFTDVWTFDELCSSSRIDLFSSNVLANVADVSITVRLEILSINDNALCSSWNELGIQM